jgi:hypothetical protein
MPPPPAARACGDGVQFPWKGGSTRQGQIQMQGACASGRQRVTQFCAPSRVHCAFIGVKVNTMGCSVLCCSLVCWSPYACALVCCPCQELFDRLREEAASEVEMEAKAEALPTSHSLGENTAKAEVRACRPLQLHVLVGMGYSSLGKEEAGRGRYRCRRRVQVGDRGRHSSARRLECTVLLLV